MKFVLILVCLFSIQSFAVADDKGTVVAFSYLQNRSSQKEYDYLSKILPNSLADSFRSNFGIIPIKPQEIEDMLKKTNSGELKDFYNDFELPDFVRKLPGVRYFIYGYFIPNDNGTIEIVTSVYCANSMEVFTFSTTGKMETELFVLVDRVIKSFSTLITQDIVFSECNIPDKSKIAFLTNIDGNELNTFMNPFLEHGYSIISLQANELYSGLPGDHLLDRFRYTALSKISYDRVRSDKLVKFEYSISDNSKSIKNSNKLQNTVLKYYYNFPKQHEDSLKNLSKTYNYHIDFLFIVIFDDKSKSASLQCFDLRKFTAKLVWFQTGIRVKESGEFQTGIANEILSSMEHR